ncbi:MAG: nucleoside triphosphate pyrophosphohydrolase [Leptonema sp. (in: Bacteria)]|nr:nucleoside triphosphate pyrophosphohydrolase [Leptonema sp. (in: bacteria)]
MSSRGQDKTRRLSQIESPFERLKEITAILRHPGGCDWDQAQTLHSMREDLIEETSEVVAAINSFDQENLKEELGDLAFLVLFLTQIAEDQGWFNSDSVYNDVCEKLIFRHPHVFGDLEVSGQTQILQNWEKLKQKEEAKKAKNGQPKLFGDGTKHLAALMRADKIQSKASRLGFDWKKGDLQSLIATLRGEIDELEQAISTESPTEIEEELGDVLFSVVNLGRHLDVSAELSLQASTEKFIDRFRRLQSKAQSSEQNPFTIDDADLRRIKLEELYKSVIK